jgi:hypothetical protein
MADLTVKILTPALNFDLMTLAELKMALGMLPDDVSQDDTLNFLIDQQSSVVSALTNRVFARERVRETWRYLGGNRIFLQHWPVKEIDIESVVAGGLPVTDYELEEASGKVSNFNGWREPVVVTYTGGFAMPSEVPPALKQAVALLVKDVRVVSGGASSALESGVRMIQHKDSRVMYYQAGTTSSTTSSTGAGTSARTAVTNLLQKYMRVWV